MTKSEEGYSLRLVLDDGQLEEERHYKAPSCDEVVGAATVAMALLMQNPSPERLSTDNTTTPGSGGQEAFPTEEDSNGNEGQSASEKAEAKNSKSSSKTEEQDGQQLAKPPGKVRETSIRLLITAPTLSMSLGPLPHIGWGLGARAGVEVARWRFLLGGTWYLNNNVSSKDYADSGASLDRANLSLLSCRWLSRGSIEWAPCVQITWEHLRARGEGVNVIPQDQQANWMALGPAIAARARLLGSFALIFGTSLEFQTARPKIVITGQGELAQISLLALTTNVGAEWIF